jgi:hypothetical protein
MKNKIDISKKFKFTVSIGLVALGMALSSSYAASASGLDPYSASPDVGGGGSNTTFTDSINIPANNASWGASPLRATAGTSSTVQIASPTWAARSRIRVGTAGAVTSAQEHAAASNITRAHTHGAARGTNVRAELSWTQARPNSATTLTNWRP